MCGRNYTDIAIKNRTQEIDLSNKDNKNREMKQRKNKQRKKLGLSTVMSLELVTKYITPTTTQHTKAAPKTLLKPTSASSDFVNQKNC